MDDDALSDGGEEELTKEQQGIKIQLDKYFKQSNFATTAQMDEGLERVRALLGPFETTGLDDKVVKDALWNEYFDVERSVDWLLGSAASAMRVVPGLTVTQRNAIEDKLLLNAKVSLCLSLLRPFPFAYCHCVPSFRSFAWISRSAITGVRGGMA